MADKQGDLLLLLRRWGTLIRRRGLPAENIAILRHAATAAVSPASEKRAEAAARLMKSARRKPKRTLTPFRVIASVIEPAFTGLMRAINIWTDLFLLQGCFHLRH